MFSDNAADTRDWVRMIQLVSRDPSSRRPMGPSADTVDKVSDDWEASDGDRGRGPKDSTRGGRIVREESGVKHPANDKGLGHNDAALSPLPMYGECRSHTADFTRQRAACTRSAINEMECIRTRVDKYLQIDPKRWEEIFFHTHTHFLSLSLSPPSSRLITRSNPSQQDIVEKYSKMRQEVNALAQKINELQMEQNEHACVLLCPESLYISLFSLFLSLYLSVCLLSLFSSVFHHFCRTRALILLLSYHLISSLHPLK